MTGPVVSTTPMRVGLLHQYRLSTSGSGIYLRRLAGDLLARGHSVSLMSHDAKSDVDLPGAVPAHRLAGGAVYRTHEMRGAGTPVAYPRAEEPDAVLFRDLSDHELTAYLTYHVDRVTRIVMTERLDVLHANSEIPMAYVAAMVSRRTGVPYVTVAHGSTLEYLYRCDPRYRELCHIGLLESSHIVVLNDDVRERVLEVAPEVASRLRNVSPGVDCSVFRPRAGDRGPALVYVGRISADKGVFLLLGALPELAARVPGLSLCVVGEGPARELLERFAAALGDHDLAEAESLLRLVVQPVDEPWVAQLVRSWRELDAELPTPLNVSFTGQLEPAQVAARMAAADAVVVPSLVREAFPLVVLEALASGAPPLVVAAGGLGAVLAEIAPRLGEFGTLLALPADPEQLARELPWRVAALLAWLAESGHREAARASCRALAVDAYSWGRVGANLESLYSEAASTSLLALQDYSQGGPA